MKTTISGSVTIHQRERKSCISYLDLFVKIFQVSLNTEKLILNKPINETGELNQIN